MTEKRDFQSNPVPLNKEIPKRHSMAHPPRSPTDPTPFCDDNPSNNPTPTTKHPHHYAHIFTPLTIYRHKPENPNPKKNLRAKTLFLQKSCAQKNENESIPLFWGFHPNEKSRCHFWGIRFRDKTSGIYKPEVLEISIHNSDKIEL